MLNLTLLKKQFLAQKYLFLRLKIISRAPKTKWGEVLANDTIKVYIAAQPVRNFANREMMKFLCKEFGAQECLILAGKGEAVKLIKISLEK